MKDIVFVDPKNWLSTFDLKTTSHVYVNQIDGLNKSGFHVMINDFIDPVEFQPDEYDLVLYTGLENIENFRKKIFLGPNTYVVSLTAQKQENHFCNPAFLYAGASRYQTTPIKPNYNARFLADAFIGRISETKIGRAWSYYQILSRGWQYRLIVTARQKFDPTSMDQKRIPADIWRFLEDSKKVFGDIGQTALPNYDSCEHENLQTQFTDLGLDPNQVFTDFFSHDTNITIPNNIYRETLYSLLMTDSNAVMLDEKLTKPIICRRPFIVIGPQGYLAHLRDLGLQTFDPVIDESYDQIENDQERWNRAFDSLDKLSLQNPQSVYDRLRKRLQHNRKLAYNSEYWISKLKSYLNSVIEQHTGQKCVIY